jgi:ribosomal-protein-alanine N-acetyltransferase
MFTPPAPYQIRAMQLTDLPAVRAIEQLSLPTPTKASTYEYELTKNELAHYQALTVNSRSLIGYSGYWLIADEVHISIIAIHPDWRGRGLGELLLLNMLSSVQDQPVNSATLEVRASNTTAQALYSKYNFVVLGERAKYYGNGETALIMTADLPLPDIAQRADTLLARLRSEA